MAEVKMVAPTPREEATQMALRRSNNRYLSRPLQSIMLLSAISRFIYRVIS